MTNTTTWGNQEAFTIEALQAAAKKIMDLPYGKFATGGVMSRAGLDRSEIPAILSRGHDFYPAMPLYSSPYLPTTTAGEDWSQVRSPGRARRRRAQGHRQNIRYISKPVNVAYVIDNAAIVANEEVCRQITETAAKVLREARDKMGLNMLFGTGSKDFLKDDHGDRRWFPIELGDES